MLNINLAFIKKLFSPHFFQLRINYLLIVINIYLTYIKIFFNKIILYNVTLMFLACIFFSPKNFTCYKKDIYNSSRRRINDESVVHGVPEGSQNRWQGNSIIQPRQQNRCPQVLRYNRVCSRWMVWSGIGWSYWKERWFRQR